MRLNPEIVAHLAHREARRRLEGVYEATGRGEVPPEWGDMGEDERRDRSAAAEAVLEAHDRDPDDVDGRVVMAVLGWDPLSTKVWQDDYCEAFAEAVPGVRRVLVETSLHPQPRPWSPPR